MTIKETRRSVTASASNKMLEGLRSALTRRTLRTTRRLPRMEKQMMTSIGRVTSTFCRELISSCPS